MATIEEVLANDAKPTALTQAIFNSADTDRPGHIEKRELQAP